MAPPEWFENTPLLPQRGKYSYFAKSSGRKIRLKAERVRCTKWGQSLFIERDCPHFVKAKPETEHFLHRWGKKCVLLSPLAEPLFKRFYQSPSLILCDFR